ncbi:MAG: TrbI/VirB10 family protein [Vicinamibacterales bacterium]
MESPQPSPGSDPPAAPTVTDRRVPPRGVVPRGIQTWLLAGLALFMLLVMLVVGRPEPEAPRAAVPPPPAEPGQSADRVRQYQERLRFAEAQALAQTQSLEQTPARTAATPFGEPTTPPPEDPLVAERRRREYESLFASNVVLSRRPESDRPDSGRSSVNPVPVGSQTALPSGPPSIDDIADAAIRATSRAGYTMPAGANAAQPAQLKEPPESKAPTEDDASRTPRSTEPIRNDGPVHRLLEGTVIDTILTNRLDGDFVAPVNCLVTNPVYSHAGQFVVIPAGARVLGETRPVQAQGERRLAVAFHRLIMPDGSTVRLDQFMGLNQLGDAGLRDRVNQHYLSTFGAAAAVGLVSGLSQFVGSAGLARGDGDRTVVIAGGVGDSTSQATLQVMNRFLNRLPTITIREGHRVKVYLTSDIELPAYVEHLPVLGAHR